MQIHPKAKIELVVSEEENRRVIGYPYLDSKEGCIVATNGRVLVIVHVDNSESDYSGYIPPAALDFARMNRDYAKNCEISVGDDFVSIEPESNPGARFMKPEPGIFPKYETVVPKGWESYSKVHINPAYFLAACEAMGIDVEDGDAVTVYYPNDPREAIVLRPTTEKTGSKTLAVLMPIVLRKKRGRKHLPF